MNLAAGDSDSIRAHRGRDEPAGLRLGPEIAGPGDEPVGRLC